MSKYLPGYRDRGDTLERFIDREIRTPPDFLEHSKKAVDSVVKYLHQMSSDSKYRKYSFNKIVKSGSLGKGTSIKTTADVDLVVFLNGYRCMEELIKDKPQILEDIKNYMCSPFSWTAWLFKSPPKYVENITVARKTGYHIEFKVTVKFHGVIRIIDVDVLPAIDIISMKGTIQEVHKEMKTKDERVRSHYSVCFCQKQIALFGPYPTSKLKDLVRLLKYWKMVNQLYSVKSYCCEVVALYLHKSYLNEKPDFNMIDGFKAAMILFCNLGDQQLRPSPYYDETDFTDYYPDNYIIDPVNPYSDTLPSWEQSKIANCAKKTIAALNNEPEEASSSCIIM